MSAGTMRGIMSAGILAGIQVRRLPADGAGKMPAELNAGREAGAHADAV